MNETVPAEVHLSDLLGRLREYAEQQEARAAAPGDWGDVLMAATLREAADALERAEQALRGLLAACEQLAGQQAMPDDFWLVEAHMARLALRAISPAA